jgi:hypothetical protein
MWIYGVRDSKSRESRDRIFEGRAEPLSALEKYTHARHVLLFEDGGWAAGIVEVFQLKL